MKKIILSILVISLSYLTTIAQDSCSKFYPMIEGSSFEYTNYNKKGKIEGITNYNVTAVTSEGSATNVTIELHLADKKGKPLYDSNYNFICDNNIVKIDYKSLFPAQMMQQYTKMGMEMDISGTDIEIPNDLSVGKELSDANVSVNMVMGGMKMEIKVDQTNRKVEKKETVTTSAGSFECFVITEQTTSKTMGVNIEMSTRLWLSEGIGMVKHETYKKNGDLLSKSELTKYSK